MSVRAKRVRIAGKGLHGEVPDQEASRTTQRGPPALFAHLPSAGVACSRAQCPASGLRSSVPPLPSSAA
jgi:hypothetical protein